ncbi:MAG: CYTH domain-containing protein [bacterium]
MSYAPNKKPENIEIEAKFLDIDPKQIEARLVAAGAQKLGDFLYRSKAFDFPGFPLDAQAAWVRLRDEGDQVMLAFKKRLGAATHDGSTSDTGMQEIEVKVSDYDKTALLLESIGMVLKFAQEKKRTRWVLGDIQFDLDEWPRLKPYLEIESTSWEKVDEGARLVGLDPASKKLFSTTQVYALNGIRDKDYVSMTFGEWVRRD